MKQKSYVDTNLYPELENMKPNTRQIGVLQQYAIRTSKINTISKHIGSFWCIFTKKEIQKRVKNNFIQRQNIEVDRGKCTASVETGETAVKY